MRKYSDATIRQKHKHHHHHAHACTYRNEKRSVGRKSCCKRLGFGRGTTTNEEEVEAEEEEEEEARKAVVARLHTVERTGDQEAPISMRALSVAAGCGVESGECVGELGERGACVSAKNTESSDADEHNRDRQGRLN